MYRTKTLNVMYKGIKKTLRFILLVLCLYAFKTSFASSTPGPIKAGITNPFKINDGEAKDTLYLLDGRVLPITYLEETGMKVKFKKEGDPLNRTWGKEKTKISKIVLISGEVITYDQSRYYPRSESNNAGKVVGGIAIAVGAAILTTSGVVVWLVGDAIGIW